MCLKLIVDLLRIPNTSKRCQTPVRSSQSELHGVSKALCRLQLKTTHANSHEGKALYLHSLRKSLHFEPKFKSTYDDPHWRAAV